MFRSVKTEEIVKENSCLAFVFPAVLLNFLIKLTETIVDSYG